MTAPSFDDLYNLGRSEAIIRRPELLIATGDISDMILAASAAMGDAVVAYLAEQIRATFLDGASGDALAKLTDDHWGIQRQDAAAAVGQVTFTRPSSGGGEPSGSLAIGFIVATEPDENGERQEYALTAAASWALSETGDKTVAVAAAATGRAGNAVAGAVTALTSVPFDSTITVTNAAPMAGGVEAESDEALRERARQFPATLRRGTLAALEYGAKLVVGVATATATESATGLVAVYIADADGLSNYELEQAVAEELENWRAAGVVVEVAGGTLVEQAINYSLTVALGTDVAALEPLIESALTARLERLPVSDGTSAGPAVLRREVIASTVIAVDPAAILGVTVATPAADVVPPAGSLVRAGVITRS